MPSSAVGEVRDVDPPGGQAGRDHVGHQPVDLGQVGALRDRQVDRDALDRDAVDQRRRLAQVARGEAVPAHRRQPLEHDPRPALVPRPARRRSSSRPTVCTTWLSKTARVSNGRHGVSTMIEPSKCSATRATSWYIPTATVSTPSQAACAGEPVRARSRSRCP